jgi:hypothetical protein
MWCSTCQQDVPGVESSDAQALSCPRCGENLHRKCGADSSDGGSNATGTGLRDRPEIPARVALLYHGHPPAYDNWGLDLQLRRVESLLGAEKIQVVASTERNARVDAPHVEVKAPHPRRRRSGTVVQRVEEFQSQGVLPVLTWTALLLGTMIVVCGGSLVFWSWVANRPELWRVGQPIALGGVCALVAALALYVDRAWQDERPAEAGSRSGRGAGQHRATGHAAS